MDEIDSLLTQSTDPEHIFELLDVLGQGAYGSVSKVIHKQTGERYAVKILPATNIQQLNSIKKEISILRQCDDQHIVRYYGCYLKDNNLWIIMEYCDAGSITDIMHITEKNLNENQIASILESVLKGLMYLHERKKIHRDIKAANILLDRLGRAKLADFGVSTESKFTNDRHKTHIGSPYWMSPEVLKYSQYTHKTDLWSLGVTSIQLAEGAVPYSDVKPYRAMWKMRQKPIQSLSQPQKWSPEFNSFITLCLELSPNDRPQARQLLQHPFIVQKSRGQRLLAELAFNCLEEIQEYRRGSESNSNSFADGIVIEGGSIRNLTIIRAADGQDSLNHTQRDSLIESERDPLQGSFIINEDVDINGSMLINDQSEKPPQSVSNCLSQYISNLKHNNSLQNQRKQALQKSISNADKDCLKELTDLFQKCKDKALKESSELSNIEGKDIDLKQYHILNSCTLNHFLQLSLSLLQKSQSQKFTVIGTKAKAITTKDIALQVSRSLSKDDIKKSKSVNKKTASVLNNNNPFFNEQLQEKVGQKLVASNMNTNFNRNSTNLNVKQFMEDPVVMNFLRRNSNPLNNIGQIKLANNANIVNLSANTPLPSQTPVGDHNIGYSNASNAKSIRESNVNTNIQNMNKFKRSEQRKVHHITQPAKSKEKPKNKPKKNKQY